MAKSCKPTHTSYGGHCIPKNVNNKALYLRIKQGIQARVQSKGQRWGAYTSGNLVQAYKRKGGTYSGRKTSFIKQKKKSSRKKSGKRRKSKRRKSKRRKSKRRKSSRKKKSKKSVKRRKSKKNKKKTKRRVRRS